MENSFFFNFLATNLKEKENKSPAPSKAIDPTWLNLSAWLENIFTPGIIHILTINININTKIDVFFN